MKKVVIGLVTKHKDINKKRTLTYVCDEIKDVIFKNNAIAVGIIPSMKSITLVNTENENEIYNNLDNLFTQEEKDNMIAQINFCDGIILSGGSESDAYEIWIAKYCYENNIPILGICAGHNNLVRAVGGTTKSVDNQEIHRQLNAEYVHAIKINKSSQFYSFVGVKNMRVNSRHKNTINKQAKLDVCAYDEFGNIEITEDKTKKCYIGMKFHPESLCLVDKLHNNIFKKFIEICKKN